jgi:hypothetical protein
MFWRDILTLLEDNKLYETISLYNYQYAQSHFLASRAALRLEKIYETVLGNFRLDAKENPTRQTITIKA